MTRLKRVGVMVVLATVLGIATFYALRPAESSYQGRSLSTWLATINDDTREVPEEFFYAIEQMGTNAVPRLLRLLQSRPSPLKEKCYAVINRVFGTEYSDDVDIDLARRRSLAGFSALGSKAKSAIPKLIQLLSDPGLGELASDALSQMGPAATGALMKCVASTNPATRSAAVRTLWMLGTNAEPANLALAERLMDPLETADVRSYSARALGRIGKQPEHVVPALASVLSDTNLRIAAMGAIYLFGTNATSAIPALVPLLEDPDTNVARAAQHVLSRIDSKTWATDRKK